VSAHGWRYNQNRPNGPAWSGVGGWGDGLGCFFCFVPIPEDGMRKHWGCPVTTLQTALFFLFFWGFEIGVRPKAGRCWVRFSLVVFFFPPLPPCPLPAVRRCRGPARWCRLICFPPPPPPPGGFFLVSPGPGGGVASPPPVVPRSPHPPRPGARGGAELAALLRLFFFRSPGFSRREKGFAGDPRFASARGAFFSGVPPGCGLFARWATSPVCLQAPARGAIGWGGFPPPSPCVSNLAPSPPWL